jgi:hypothetical protein
MKKIILIPLFVFMVLGLVGGACSKPADEKKVTKESVKTSGWEEFISAEHKLTMKYPKEWVRQPEIDKAHLLTFSFNKGEYMIVVRVEENVDNMSAKDFAVKQYISSGKESEKAKLKDYSVNGLTGFTDSGPVTPEGKYTRVGLAPNNGKYYGFTFSSTDDLLIDEFYQMIEALKFSD